MQLTMFPHKTSTAVHSYIYTNVYIYIYIYANPRVISCGQTSTPETWQLADKEKTRNSHIPMSLEAGNAALPHALWPPLLAVSTEDELKASPQTLPVAWVVLDAGGLSKLLNQPALLSDTGFLFKSLEKRTSSYIFSFNERSIKYPFCADVYVQFAP